jgi:hypothetical protein
MDQRRVMCVLRFLDEYRDGDFTQQATRFLGKERALLKDSDQPCFID